ncbi:MAG: BMP family ABC transporter substrate-binding protein [Fournierella sp.]|uniref:BMP family lipoprotein n=1 Tax=Allofournierella sp. TaxID=1940256 RepID=UPI0025BCF618|nr:BMP family ABC transporter substrate-binding protein [Fournierella sp.]MDY4166704.1 BMP family ABC transporter substrate-binding protein [Fournierella sp.]
MKKLISIVLVAAMALSMVACGGASSAPASTGASSEAASTAASGEATSGKEISVGMITDVGGVNDRSFNQTSWEGLQALAEQNPNISVSYLESKTDADYGANIETYLSEGTDLIICVGYMLAEATKAAAEANPDQLFAIIDDSSIDLPNVACLMFSQAEASYLVGIVAGLATESNTVGYVQGMVSDSMNQFGCGFIAGVKSVNPEATVLQFNANSFGDPTGGNTAATDMITKGADVVFHAAGATGNGVIEACKANGVYAIGVDTDQAPLAPETVITSAMKRVDIAAQDISLAVANGTFTPGVHLYSLENGGVDLSPTRDLLTEEMLTAVEDAKAKIIAGEVTVPSTPDELGDGLFTLK